MIVSVYSLDVSPDGNWLIALNGTSSQLDVYQINQTTGALSLTSAVSYPITNTSVLAEEGKGVSGWDVYLCGAGE